MSQGNAVIYARGYQGGLPVGEQVLKCKEFCDDKGIKVVHVITEPNESSGYPPEFRNGFKETMMFLEDGFSKWCDVLEDRCVVYYCDDVLSDDKENRLGAINMLTFAGRYYSAELETKKKIKAKMFDNIRGILVKNGCSDDVFDLISSEITYGMIEMSSVCGQSYRDWVNKCSVEKDGWLED